MGPLTFKVIHVALKPVHAVSLPCQRTKMPSLSSTFLDTSSNCETHTSTDCPSNIRSPLKLWPWPKKKKNRSDLIVLILCISFWLSDPMDVNCHRPWVLQSMSRVDGGDNPNEEPRRFIEILCGISGEGATRVVQEGHRAWVGEQVIIIRIGWMGVMAKAPLC